MDAPNSFALEIEEDYHQTLLETGNLIPKPKLFGENTWQSLGYLARVNRIECVCGAHQTTLVGVFHAEGKPDGTRRELALGGNFQIPLGDPHPVEVQILHARVCPSCLPSKGFSEFPL